MIRSLLTICLVCFASLAWALEAPKGQILLTVTGEIASANADNKAQFDRAMLEALDWKEIESYTEFNDGLQTFAGPTLVSLLAELGVTDGTLNAIALDDYIIQIPVEDAAMYNVILALEWNGKKMRVRDKGPIWVIYPAADPSDLNELLSSRMIWQLKSIAVER